MVLCGAQPVFYTYPAWTFPGKRREHRGADGSPGPGFVPQSTFDTMGPRMGPPRARPKTPSASGPVTPPTTPPARPRGPAYSFGLKPRDARPENDGPGFSYRGHDTMTAPAVSWGPPPRNPRPASAPLRRDPDPKAPYRARGPTFGHLYPQHIEVSPGPLDYAGCNCGCKSCQTYNGVTLKGRRPMFYGKVSTQTPGPAGYHTDCSTIGVATAACASGPPRPRR